MRASAVYTGIVVPSFVVLPIVAALFKTKYWKAPQRLSFFYLVLSGVFNIIAKITAVHQINNLPFFAFIYHFRICFAMRIFLKVFL